VGGDGGRTISLGAEYTSLMLGLVNNRVSSRDRTNTDIKHMMVDSSLMISISLDTRIHSGSSTPFMYLYLISVPNISRARHLAQHRPGLQEVGVRRSREDLLSTSADGGDTSSAEAHVKVLLHIGQSAF
jgi:hypothetical protein